MRLGRRRLEAVLLRAVQVYEVAPLAVNQFTAASVYHVGIDVYGIAGIGNGNYVVFGIYIAQVAEVALGTVRHEDVIGRNAETGIVTIGDGLAQKAIALLRTVAMESIAGRHIIYGTVHGLYAGLRYGQRNVADVHTDHLAAGMRLLIFTQLAGYRRKQVALRQFLKIIVNLHLYSISNQQSATPTSSLITIT